MSSSAEKQWFSQIVGNEQVKRYLCNMVNKGAIANSLLFVGPEGIQFAKAFAGLLICAQDPQNTHKFNAGTHPDLRIYHPEGKIGVHSIDSMRQFSEEVYLPPYEAAWKVFIIHEAERMLSYSANALLKTFEEPALRSVIILLSNTPERLLPTILSRCRLIRFHATVCAIPKATIDHALREQLLKILSSGKMKDYRGLLENARVLSEQIELLKKKTEDDLRKAIMTNYPEGMTSVQQESVEKEIEGAGTLCLANTTHALFDVILSWYRDMHLLHVNGNPAYLLNFDFKEQCDQALQRAELLSLEAVQTALAQARLALERSTPLHNCLENLFLQLHFV